MLKTVHVVVGVTTLNGITAILAPVRCSRSPTPTWSRSLRPAVCTTPRQCTSAQPAVPDTRLYWPSGSKPGHCVLKTTQGWWSVATDAVPAPLRLKAGALRAKVHPGVVVGGYGRCTSATPDPTPMHCGLKTARGLVDAAPVRRRLQAGALRPRGKNNDTAMYGETPSKSGLVDTEFVSTSEARGHIRRAPARQRRDILANDAHEDHGGRRHTS